MAAALPASAAGSTEQSPSAGLNKLVRTPAGARVTGWATDPASTAAITVHITVDGSVVQTVTADQNVVGHPGHGFATAVPVTAGPHTVCAVGVNVAGNSRPACRTLSFSGTTQPPPQRTPAPVSTSRYVRNISGSSPTDLATMRAEGYQDAQANPSGHRYLILLDIGGQDQVDGGVVLSATTRFVKYSSLEADLHAYVDGYHSGQRPNAPVTIAAGTNNDMDVGVRSGQTWASAVVGPLRRYALRYPGMRIAGADDMEPGFRATYQQTSAWLSGYLSRTIAPFVFNGSADGCSPIRPNAGCNNGWQMAGMYHLAAGAAPPRIVNLPQIYNTTMAAQWKYISLTGIDYRQPRVNFGGPLTEWTACQQARSCGSLTGHTAWSVLWGNLQSDIRLRVNSLPYSTDLRIDR